MNRELNAKVTAMVMGEIEPPKTTDEELDDATGVVGIFVSHRSEGGNWYIVRRYESGDEPEWEANNFSGSMPHAIQAVHAYFGEAPNLMLEYYRRQDSGRLEWSAYADTCYGYGETPEEAVCNLLVKFAESSRRQEGSGEGEGR